MDPSIFMSVAEAIRRKTITDLLKIKTVQKCWPSWQHEIRARAGNPPTVEGLLEQLGTNLGAVFRTTSSGRTQSEVSQAGIAWEALVTWYLNLCLMGTRAVVTRNATANWPEPIRDALTVTYGTVKTNTESDLLGVIFPKHKDLDNFASNYTGTAKREIDKTIAGLLGQISVCVIQCKTNWNDTAQIPMMWDMIYSARGFVSRRAVVGKNGHSVNDFSDFRYAFATVPSNDVSKFNRNSMPVLRCANLSGGVFWGRPAANGIAESIADIFGRNFGDAFKLLPTNWRTHLAQQLHRLKAEYDYFAY